MSKYARILTVSVVMSLVLTGCWLYQDDSEAVPDLLVYEYVDGTTAFHPNLTTTIGGYVRIQGTADRPLVGFNSAHTTIANNGGLVYHSGNTVIEGYITEPTAINGGEIWITYNDLVLGEEENLVLIIEPMVSSQSDPFNDLSVPATSLYYLNNVTSYIRVGSALTIQSIETPEGGPEDTWSITSVTSGFGLSVDSTGTLTGTISKAGTITIGVQYNSTTPRSITFEAIGEATLTVSKSTDTLYLVTGKTVPNTPAEAVTFSHNDVGTGATYSWQIIGVNATDVSISADGVLGGTPGAVGTYTLKIRCTSEFNGNTQTADTTLTVVIVPVLKFTSTPPSGTWR